MDEDVSFEGAVPVPMYYVRYRKRVNAWLVDHAPGSRFIHKCDWWDDLADVFLLSTRRPWYDAPRVLKRIWDQENGRSNLVFVLLISDGHPRVNGHWRRHLKKLERKGLLSAEKGAGDG
jgi:hypothetical protein